MKEPARIQALLEELEKDAGDYEEAKEVYERSRVQFEVSRERFAHTKALASNMMGPGAWHEWLSRHPALKYTGAQIGDAIFTILESLALSAALAFSEPHQHLSDRHHRDGQQHRSGVDDRRAGGSRSRPDF